MTEKMVMPSWRSVKFEPGTQKTFDGETHALFINSQYKLLKEFGEEKLNFPAGLMKALGEVADLEADASVESKKSMLTELLKAKDSERDKALRHIFGMIRTQLHSPFTAEREAAEMLDTKLRNFRYIRHQGYDVESGNIDSMLMDAERLKTEIGILRLTDSFEWLEGANKAYKELVSARDAEQLANRKPSMRKLRPQADELYELVCQYIQASYLLAKTTEARDEIEALVDRMNHRVRNIKISYRKSVGQRRRKKEDKDPEGE